MAPDQDDFPHDPLSEALAAEAGLRGVARALLADPQAAEDAVQHAWLRWLQHGRGVPLPFLRRAVRNEAIDQRRSRARRTARETDAAREDLAPSAAEMVAGEQERRRLWAAVHALDEPYRGTIWLRFYEDLPPRGVAKRLGIPVETVRTRTRRGLEILRQRLEQEGGSDWRGRLAMAFGLPLLVATSPIPLLVGGLVAAVLVVGIASAWLVGGGSAVADSGAAGEVRVAIQPGSVAPEVAVSDALQDASGRRAVVVDAAAATPAAARSVEIVHADGTPAANLPVWLWDRPLPRQAWVPERESALGTPMHDLEAPPREGAELGNAGWTDARGHCRLAAAPVFGVTVGIDEDTWLSVAGAVERVVLPALAEVTVEVVPPGESLFTLRLYPARIEDPSGPEDYEYALADSRAITTASGPAVLFLRRRVLRDASCLDRHSILLPAGELFAAEVEGFPLQLTAETQGVRAPGRLLLRGGGEPVPGVHVQVLEPDGLRTESAGVVIVRPVSGDDGQGFTALDLEGGYLNVTLPRPEVANELVVVLEDGELFETRLAVVTDASRMCSFVRGEGVEATEFRMPPGADGMRFAALVVEEAAGGLRYVPDALRLPHPWGAPVVTWGVTSGTLRLRGMPEDWRTAWLCADDGTLFRVMPGTPAVLPESMEELPPVALGQVHAERGMPDYIRYVLELVFLDARGGEVVVPLRWIRVDPLTSELPDWPLRRSAVASLRLRCGAGQRGVALSLPR